LSPQNAFARDVRLHRLFRHGDRLLVVPLDHSVTDGPIVREPGGLDELVGEFARSEVDAIVVHKGSTRQLNHRWFTDMSLIIHLSASTMHAEDPDAKYLVATVPEALRLGADAVSVHLNLGSRDEARQVSDLAMVAAACDEWHLPLLVMAYPRGPRITDPRDPALIAHAATLSADLGADIVKVPYTGSAAEMADVIRGCPIPLIVAGGPRLAGTAEILHYVDEIMRAGAAGLAMGRNIFQAPDPGELARQIARRIRVGAQDPARPYGGQLAA
jgi:2-amino-4,5-dihydroxy-6-oxo-7-(phosphooxy)heptanoate synthase